MRRLHILATISVIFLAACNPTPAAPSAAGAEPTAAFQTPIVNPDDVLPSSIGNINGTWTGTLTETSGDQRVFEATMTLFHDMGTGNVSGTLAYHYSAESFDEQMNLIGNYNLSQVQLSSDTGHYYDLTLEAGGVLTGTVAFDCFECPPWGELTVSYTGEAPAAEPGPITDNITGPEGLIAYASDATGDYEIYTVTADGSNVTQLTFRPDMWDVSPQWSADGQTIAFFSYLPGAGNDETGIWLMDADGGNLRQIKIGDAGPPVWSPDGTWLAFSNNTSLFAMTADGGVQMELVNGINSNLEFITAPSWSPDGTQLAFHARDLGSGTGYLSIFILSSDGSSLVKIRDTAYRDSVLPVWKGQESLFFMERTTGAVTDLYLLNPQGMAEKITENYYLVNYAVASDFSKVVLHEGARLSVWDAATPQITTLRQSDTFGPSDIDLSPDNIWAVTGMEIPLVINTVTGEMIELPISGAIFGYSWRP
jgi:dipeptidyl aminopeptidase/acylaminoacyl peptidase